MNTSCTNCGQQYTVDTQDMAYYEKVSPVFNRKIYLVPPPTHCNLCRQQRRFSYRNERSLYHRKCDMTGKTMISSFAPDGGMKAYEHGEWFGDNWDPKDYGRDFDFSRSFFEQFKEMQFDVPQLGLSIWHSENADYCNYVGNVRNSYLIFGSVYSEDCYYGSPYYSKDCMDTLVVRECEKCYECVDSRKLYQSYYCQDCHSSNHLIYCYDLQGCTECIACAGLRNKKFNIFNVQYSEDEYKKMKQELDLCNPTVQKKLQDELKKLSLSIPHRFMQSNKIENVTGNYIYESKNVQNSYYVDRSEDCSYCAQVVDLKDCYDNNYTEENELCYEYLGAYQNTRVSFSKFCNLLSNALYCDACHSSKDLFGCIGIRNAQYCIFNKQYTKEEYEQLVPKIIEHMQSTKEWGEFFPIENSPYGYNETVAMEYYLLDQQQVESNGWKWRKEDPNQEKYMGPATIVSQNIDDVDETILEKILQCKTSKKLFRVIEQELDFYKELHLPIPELCPNERHRLRIAKRTPRTLWNRTCAKCSKEIQTTYAPERPETVYCESCYLKTIT